MLHLLLLIQTNNLIPGRALDCAAGIGRVTQYVLVNFFNIFSSFSMQTYTSLLSSIQ